jgi:hypothetical protein
MVLLLSMGEANCLAHQLRRTSSSTNCLDLTRSAYRASGLVHWPIGDRHGLLSGRGLPTYLSQQHTSRSRQRTALVE